MQENINVLPFYLFLLLKNFYNPVGAVDWDFIPLEVNFRKIVALVVQKLLIGTVTPTLYLLESWQHDSLHYISCIFSIEFTSGYFVLVKRLPNISKHIRTTL